MIAIILEHASPALKGTITKWVTLVKPNVYIGNVNKRIRETLTSKIQEEYEETKEVSAQIYYDEKNELGYSVVEIGNPTKTIVDFQGLNLVSERNNKDALYTISKLCWAKLHPYKSLYNHMYETGILAKTFLKTSKYCALLPLFEECITTKLTAEECISTLAFIVALHDIGKAYPNFQKKAILSEPLEWQVEQELKLIENNSMLDGDTTATNFRHEIASEIAINRILKKNNTALKTRKVIKTVYRNHHLIEEKFSKAQMEMDYECCEPKKWDEVQENLFCWLKKDFSPCLDFELKNGKETVFATLLMGFLYRCDWISSSIFTKTDFDSYDEYKEYVASTSIKYVDSMQINKISFVDKNTIASIFPELVNLRPLQQKAEELSTTDFDCLLIEDLTGSGKTEVGFFLAYQAMCRRQKQGIFFGLPTNATEETMNPRIQTAIDEIYEKNSVSVSRATGTSWIKEALNCDSSELRERMGSSKETKLMFPFSTGTIDQIERGVLRQRYALIPLVELATKVVVIDEMHAYDAYMRGVLSRALSWLKEFHVPVVIMSATLPNLIKEEIHKVYTTKEFVPDNHYPLVSLYSDENIKTYPVNGFQHREYAVSLKTIDLEKTPFSECVCNTLSKLITKGGNVCVICNTVASAEETYETVTKEFPEVEAHLFHGRTTLEEKHNNTEMLISKYGKNRANRPEKSIIIATQIIEQSIDVDFDFMITELAPIDLLVQRFGRWHRHSNKGTIREINNEAIPIEVVAFTNLKKHVVYKDNTTLLENTSNYLKSHSALTVPEASRDMIESVYNVKSYKYEECAKLEKKEGKADCNTIWLPEESRTLPYDKKDIVCIKNLPTRDSEGDFLVDLCVLPAPMYENVKNNGASKKLAAEIRYRYTTPTKESIVKNIPNKLKFDGELWLNDCVITKMEEIEK